MPIFINDPFRELTISTEGNLTRISPDMEIEFTGIGNSFLVSLLSDGNLKIVKVIGKETDKMQAKKLISSLANEIIIC